MKLETCVYGFGVEDIGKTFVRSLMFPSQAFINLIVSDVDKNKIKVNEIKSEVLEFMREKKKATIFEIAEKFDLTIDVAMLVLKDLESDRKISIR